VVSAAHAAQATRAGTTKPAFNEVAEPEQDPQPEPRRRRSAQAGDPHKHRRGREADSNQQHVRRHRARRHLGQDRPGEHRVGKHLEDPLGDLELDPPVAQECEQLTQPPGERDQHHRDDHEVDRHHDEQFVRSARPDQVERGAHHPGVGRAPGDVRARPDAVREHDVAEVEVRDAVGIDVMAAGPGVAGGDHQDERGQPPAQSPLVVDPPDQSQRARQPTDRQPVYRRAVRAFVLR
jgi:hypothetical protein